MMNESLQRRQFKYNQAMSDVEQRYFQSEGDIISIINKLTTPAEKRALGCIVASYIGDSLGSYCEFHTNVTPQQADLALQANGGGPHNIIGCQGTDDSELASSLGYGLLESQKDEIDLNLIAKYYIMWLKSEPFDSGYTIKKPMENFKSDQRINYQLSSSDASALKLSYVMINSAQQANQKSESNGGCMRISPLVVYLSKLKIQEEIKRAVFSEQSLTHSNIIAQYCSYIYTRVCINLIQNGNAQLAFNDISDYIQNDLNIGIIQEWWRENVEKEEFTDTTIPTKEVWIKHPLTISLIYLKKIAQNKIELNENTLYMIFKEIIMKGGDTDTNTAIAGGMIGAIMGFDGIPNYYINKLISCNLQDLQNGNNNYPIRPPIYNPRNCIFLAYNLLNKAPTERVSIKGGNEEKFSLFQNGEDF